MAAFQSGVAFFRAADHAVQHVARLQYFVSTLKSLLHFNIAHEAAGFGTFVWTGMSTL